MGVVLVGAVFDLELQHEWEKIRGTDETSCLTRLFGHDSLQRANCSATFQLEEALKSLQSNILMHHIPQSWLFIHGYRDPIVPYKHSSDFFDLLEQTGILNVSLKSYDEPDHNKLIYDVFLGDVQEIQNEFEQLQDRYLHMQRYKRWLDMEQRNPTQQTYGEYKGFISQVALARESDEFIR